MGGRRIADGSEYDRLWARPADYRWAGHHGGNQIGQPPFSGIHCPCPPRMRLSGRKTEKLYAGQGFARQGGGWRPDSDGRSGQHGCRGQSGTGGGVYPRPAGARQTVWAYRRPFGLVDLPFFRDFYRPPRAGGRGCGLGSGAGSDRGGRRTVPADAGTGRRKASGRPARPAFAD